MSLTKRGDYVVRSALCLARAYASGEQRKIRQVVAETAVPQTFASQILADLVRAGLATSRAGRDGGFRLTRPPEEISLLQVVEAGEGPLRAERCALGEGPCRWDRVCPLHETWCEAVDALRRVLGGASLAELVTDDGGSASGGTEDGGVEVAATHDGAAGHRAGHDSAGGLRATHDGAGGPHPWLAPAARRATARPVAVHDTVQVEQAVADVAARCRDEGWLGARVVEAYAAAEALRGAVDPGGSPWGARAAPALRITRRRAAGAVASLGERPVFDIAWEVNLPGGTSRLQGTVTLRPLHPERTEIDVEGRFRLPAGPAAEGELARQLARRTVRGFVRALAQNLEHDEPPGRATA